jgi:hypothetical protein
MDCANLLQLKNVRGARRSVAENYGLHLLEPRLVQSHTTVMIPLHKRIVFVRLLHGSEFSSRLSKISQTLDAITGIQFRVGSGRLDERWSLGAVCFSRRSSV